MQNQAMTPGLCVSRRVLPVALALAIPLIAACSADIKVFPEISRFPEHLEVLARGKIVCDGDKKYLPRTIGEGRGGDDSLIIQYEYEELQGRPYKHKASEVVGRLELRSRGKVLKTYRATAMLIVAAEFSSETLSDMRRRGLFAVRDNIEAQMWDDRDVLKRLVTEVSSF
ncbi:MAG: hypothetical protein ABIU05_03350 [Nitrospirales bacterium]